MRQEEPKPKAWVILVLAGSLALCALGAWRLIDFAGDRLLRLDAELIARGWSAELTDHVELDALMTGDARAAARIGSLDAGMGLRGVRRFRLFDASGRLRFDSGETLIEANGAAPLTNRVVEPLLRDGRRLGDAEIFIDQRERSTVFRRVSLGLGASIALMLILAAAAPAYLAAQRETQRRRAECEARHAANHDPLTGLANRRRFAEALARLIEAAPEPVGLITVDLDRFKEINDSMGHHVGDEVIRQAAERLRSVVGEPSLAARTGGDEFAIAVRCDDGEAAETAHRIHEAVRAPFMIDGAPVHCSASVGFALAPTDALNGAELARCADVALQCAKHAGRDKVRSFDSAMDGALRRRRSLQADLRDAIQSDALEVHFQPLVALSTGQVKGFEALLRWRHPERGLISTQEFIGIAEESDLIIALGALVLNKACAEAASWPQPWTVAVNLSPAQFRSGELLCEVERALAASGLPASRLELEITEGLLLETNEDTDVLLERFRALGVRVALDDFGAGYSSLSYLWRLSIDKLKIDRAFILEMGEDPRIAAIVSAIVSLGAALDLEVTAEGVETASQYEQLRRLGCDTAQGFWLSRPSPDPIQAAEEAERRLSLRVVDVA